MISNESIAATDLPAPLTLSGQQDTAVAKVQEWLAEWAAFRAGSVPRPARQVFRLFGFAGTGAACWS